MPSQIVPRLGVRGGLPISALSGKVVEGAMSPAAARGFKEPLMPSKSSRRPKRDSGYASLELDEDSPIGDSSSQIVHAILEGQKKWGNVPGRNLMREKATMAPPARRLDSPNGYASSNGSGATKYVHGHLIVREIAKNIELPDSGF